MFACATGAKNTIWLRSRDWISLLISCHDDFRDGDASNRDAMHTLAHLFYNMRQIHHAKGTIEHPWERLFEGDVIPVLVDLLSDFDFDADIECHGLNIVRDHLSDLLALLASSLEYLYDTLKHSEHQTPDLDPADCPQCGAVSRALESVTTHCPAVFENIWNHRTPLFDTDREGMYRDHCNMDPEWHGLHGTVCATAYELVCHADEDKESQSRLAPTMIQVAKLCLFVWLYSVRKLQREKAVGYIQSGLTHDGGSLMYNTWYLGVTRGDVEPSQIFKAFLRDLKDKEVVGEGLARRLVLLISFRKTPAYVSLYDSMELSIFWYSLAAYRRDLCSGHLDVYKEGKSRNPFSELVSQERTFDFVTIALASSLKWHNDRRDPNAPLIPLVHIHAAIPVIAETLINRMNHEIYALFGDPYFEHVHVTINHSAWMLIQHCERQPEDPSTGSAVRPSPSMRRFSLSYWEKANDWLTAQKCHTQIRWRPICRAWKLLGGALQRGEDAFRSPDAQQCVLEPAKRCAWDECLCSAYKPTHELRLCKGCWAVAYCNSKCQTRDWENHRRACARGRRNNELDT